MERRKHYDIEGNPIWMTDEQWEKWRVWNLKMLEVITPKSTTGWENKVIITGTGGSFEGDQNISKWFKQPDNWDIINPEDK